jgi:hypothetical protein
MASLWTWTSARLKDRRTRFVDGGRFATQSPGRHSVAGRMGRGAKPPPQFGHTFFSVFLDAIGAERALVRADAGEGG